MSGEFTKLYLSQETFFEVWELRLGEKTRHDLICIETNEYLDNWLIEYPEQYILNSPGVFWCLKPQLPEECKVPKNIHLLIDAWLSTYQNRFRQELEKIYGIKHDLANEFGALILAHELRNVSGNRLVKQDCYGSIIESIYERTFDVRPIELYKLLISELRPNMIGDLNVNKYKIKPLYIDDKADRGWSKLFEGLFKCYDKDKDTICTCPENYEAVNVELLSKHDMVVLDLNLLKGEATNTPVEDRSGYKVLKKIRELDKLIPVVILTGSEKELNKSGLEDLGIVEFVTKPYPGYEFSGYQARKLVSALDKIRDNKWLHDLWNVYRHVIEPVSDKLKKSIPSHLQEENSSISDKFLAIMYKQYARVFGRSSFVNSFLLKEKKGEALYNNECTLYLHSIMTDIVSYKQNPNIEIYEPVPFCKDRIDDIVTGDYVLGEIRKRLLKALNHKRNQIYPIHGNCTLSTVEFVYFLFTVINEVSLLSDDLHMTCLGFYRKNAALREQLQSQLPSDTYPSDHRRQPEIIYDYSDLNSIYSGEL